MSARDTGPTYVYVLRDVSGVIVERDDTGRPVRHGWLCKIGIAKDIRQRMSALASYYAKTQRHDDNEPRIGPRPFEVVAAVPYQTRKGARLAEARLHTRFRGDRYAGLPGRELFLMREGTLQVIAAAAVRHGGVAWPATG